MKNLSSLAMVLMGLLIISCGKDEGGDSSSSSLSSKLKGQGIHIQTSNSNVSSNQFDQFGGAQITIECQNKNSNKVTNSKRSQYLNDLLNKVRKKAYVKLNGKKYDSNSYQNLIQQAIMSLQNGGNSNYDQFGNDPFYNDPFYNDPFYNDPNFNNNNNNNNNNQYNNFSNYNRQCPNNILAQGSVQLYYKY